MEKDFKELLYFPSPLKTTVLDIKKTKPLKSINVEIHIHKLSRLHDSNAPHIKKDNESSIYFFFYSRQYGKLQVLSVETTITG